MDYILLCIWGKKSYRNNPIHTVPLDFIENHFSIVVSFTTVSREQSHLFKLPNKNSVSISHIPRAS
jgi:hypothetical protein